MIYTANITTAKETAVTSLKRTDITVTKGLVYKVEFFFPPGSAGLMGVAVFDGLYQVWPSSVGEFFIGESQLISFDDMYLKESAPYSFQAYTYNTDDTHPHLVSVRIGLVSKDVFLARFMPNRGQEQLAKLLATMELEKAARLKRQKEIMPMTPDKWIEENIKPIIDVVPSEPEPIETEPAEPEKPTTVVEQPKTGEDIPEFGIDAFRE